jgi:uncharacterized membrane protein
MIALDTLQRRTLYAGLWFLSLLPVVTQAAGISFTLQSPLATDSIEGLIVAILEFVVIIATPIVVLFIIYSGFLYVTARGNAEQTKKATTSLTYAIIGGILILGAVALSAIIAGIVDSFTA